MKRPKVTMGRACVADQYHAPNERVVELTWPDGSGCLMSLRTLTSGQNVLDVYRVDASILVLAPVGGAPTETEVSGG